MSYADHSAREIEARGEQLYEQRVRGDVEPGNIGKFVAIDIESGEYEVDADDLLATKRLLSRRPGAVIYGLRIGHPAAYTLGGHASELPLRP